MSAVTVGSKGNTGHASNGKAIRMLEGHASRALLEDIACAFDAEVVEPMLAGGSSAKVTRLRRADGTSVVAKYQTVGAALVDGHELEALKRKVVQIRMLRAQLPRLAPYCAEVLREFERHDAYGFVMPYYEGPTVTQRLLSGQTDGLRDLGCLIDVLIERGYAEQTSAPPPEHFRHVHTDRVLRRLGLVLEHLPRAVAEATFLDVNGRRTQHARQLLERLRQRPHLLARLEPSSLSFPLHGDAVLSNFIWHCQPGGAVEFTAIDQRGALEPWDPAYDFAKMLFSLSIHDLAMADGFTIELGKRSRDSLALGLRLRNERPGYRHWATCFMDVLGSTPSFSSLPLSREACWRERILFANAMHCLAFAACRLADSRDRLGADERPFGGAKREGVLGFYLAGVTFLGALLDADSAGEALGVDEYVGLLLDGDRRAVGEASEHTADGSGHTLRALPQ